MHASLRICTAWLCALTLGAMTLCALAFAPARCRRADGQDRLYRDPVGSGGAARHRQRRRFQARAAKAQRQARRRPGRAGRRGRSAQARDRHRAGQAPGREGADPDHRRHHLLEHPDGDRPAGNACPGIPDQPECRPIAACRSAMQSRTSLRSHSRTTRSTSRSARSCRRRAPSAWSRWRPTIRPARTPSPDSSIRSRARFSTRSTRRWRSSISPPSSRASRASSRMRSSPSIPAGSRSPS